MLTDFIKKANASYLDLLSISPITNVYGLARTLLALSTLLTLLSSSQHSLFISYTSTFLEQSFVTSFSLFGSGILPLAYAKAIALLTLTLVIIGIYPRYTGIAHWYVSFSFFVSCTVVDGGDQANAVLTFLIIPLTLLDGRKWHWGGSPARNSVLQNAVAWSFVLLIRIQVSIIYLHAMIAKIGVQEWVDGTATYYWFTHHYHGASALLKPMAIKFLSHAAIVVIFTWGTILLESLLFASLFLDRQSKRRQFMLFAGLCFHFGIAAIHGLISFSITMAAALVLYLSDSTKSINFTQTLKQTPWSRAHQ